VKLCKDCRHYRFTLWQRIFGYLPKCARAKREEIVNPVDGKVSVYVPSCKYERFALGSCGSEGKHFEPKHGGKVHRPAEWPHNHNGPPPKSGRPPPPPCPPPGRRIREGEILPPPEPPDFSKPFQFGGVSKAVFCVEQKPTQRQRKPRKRR
jgi:hypothetical protein